MSLVQVEVVDAQGRRCPLDNRMVSFEVDGPAEWRGGIAQGPDNYILSKSLPVECGVNRILLRSTVKPGKIKVTAKAQGLPDAVVTMKTLPVKVVNGLGEYIPAHTLKGRLDKGPTPLTPSCRNRAEGVGVSSIRAGSSQDKVGNAIDDNEASAWTSDGVLANSWITFRLEHEAPVDDIVMKLSGWRKRSYPIEIYAGKELVWKGYTPKGLGYVHIRPARIVKADEITIRQIGAMTEKDAFALKELGGGPANEMDTKPAKKYQLGIVEIEFLVSNLL